MPSVPWSTPRAGGQHACRRLPTPLHVCGQLHRHRRAFSLSTCGCGSPVAPNASPRVRVHRQVAADKKSFAQLGIKCAVVPPVAALSVASPQLTPSFPTARNQKLAPKLSPKCPWLSWITCQAKCTIRTRHALLGAVFGRSVGAANCSPVKSFFGALTSAEATAPSLGTCSPWATKWWCRSGKPFPGASRACLLCRGLPKVLQGTS